MTDDRYLDEFEVLFLHRFPAFSTSYEGQIDCAALEKAFRTLVHDYPILGAKVDRKNDRYFLQKSTEVRPQFIKLSGGEAALLEDLRAYRGHYTKGLSRLILAEQDNRGVVALQACHSFFDGPSLLAMLTEIWRIYIETVRGSEPAEEPKESLPRPMLSVLEGLLDENDAALQDRLRSEQLEQPLDDTGTDHALVTPSYEFPIHRRDSLGKSATDGLLRAARDTKNSLHSVICAAILVALRKHAALQKGSPMTCLSTVNVRNRVSPAIPPTEAGMFAILHRSYIDDASEGNTVEVAFALKEQLDSDLRRRFPGAFDGSQSRSSRELADRRLSVSVGNAGVIPNFPCPEGMTVTGVSLIPEILFNPIVASDDKQESVAFMHAFTYDGKLTIDARFPADIFSGDDAAEIADGYMAELTQLSQRTLPGA